MEFKNKTVLVTGGSRGIGRGICTAFAAKGANVVINYSGSLDKAEETKKMCGGSAEIFKADVSSFAESAALVDFTLEKFGAVDVLVNNAGIVRDSLLMRMSEEDFDAVIATNLKGAFNMLRHTAKPFIKARSGSIINLTSVVGLHGNAGQVNYAASKAGIVGLTKAAAKELAARGITVNAIAPGFIETEMTDAMKVEAKEAMEKAIPLSCLGAVADIAKTACFLASEGARYITGQVIQVDGGMFI